MYIESGTSLLEPDLDTSSALSIPYTIDSHICIQRTQHDTSQFQDGRPVSRKTHKGYPLGVSRLQTSSSDGRFTQQMGASPALPSM